MKNISIVLCICLALWFPSQANALIISVHKNPDRNTYYNAGLCLDKYADAIGDSFHTYDSLDALTDNITLTNSEPICIVGHGSQGSAGGHTGADIGTLLEKHVTPHEDGGHTIQLMPCHAGVGNPSLVEGVVESLTDDGWQGTLVIGSNGPCSPDKELDPPYLKKVKNPLKTGTLDCKKDKQTKQNLKNIKNSVTNAVKECMKNGSHLDKANCMYSNDDISNRFKISRDYYLKNNSCYFTSNDDAFTDTQVP